MRKRANVQVRPSCVYVYVYSMYRQKRGGKKRGEKKRRARDRSGRKGAYQRAFLVASIHVSSVTRVMSVGNTRFLESNGALPFSLRCSPSPLLFISPPSRSSHSLAPPGKLLHAIYYGLYVHTCTESKARVFGTTSTMDIYTYTYKCICVYIYTYVRERCSSYLA